MLWAVSRRDYVPQNLDAYAAFLQTCAQAEADAAGLDLLFKVEPDYLVTAFNELTRKARTAGHFAQHSMCSKEACERFRLQVSDPVKARE